MFNNRTRKCCIRGCSNRFTPRSITHKVCSGECGQKIAEKISAEKTRLETLEKKRESKNNDRSYQLKLCETACNALVRERDKDLPCISCGSDDSRYRLSQGVYRTVWQAGHYKSVGSHPELRFNLDNIHKQCIYCNMELSGNQIQYRIGLVKKIGIERVEYLEMQHPAIKYTLEEIIELKRIFLAELKKLKN